MTQPNPFADYLQQPAAPAPLAAPAPAGQWLGQGAPATGGPLGALAGLGTAAAGAGTGVSMGGLLGYLLLIVPTAVQRDVPKPQARNGETQTKVTADVLVIQAPNGQTGQLTITCPGMVGDPPRIVTHHSGPDGQPDPAKPFIHNPAQGQFLAFPGMWIFGGALADKLLPCLDPNVPTQTMIAARVVTKKSNSTGNNYRDYEDPKGNQAQSTGDWPEINAVAGAWLAQRSQSQFG